MKALIPWVGGKSRLVKTLLPMIPGHTTYVEVFCGASWLLFAKEPSRAEIINDINRDLTTFYRCVKFHLDELVRYIRWTLYSRDDYEILQKQDPSSLTDIQRAVRFYFLLRGSFGAKLDFNSFKSSVARKGLNILGLEQEFSAGHVRLNGVTIENKDYEYVIKKFDRPETFFYIDPPYKGTEDYYGKGIFSGADFENLLRLCQNMQGKFMMSINAHPDIVEMFKDFQIHYVDTKYTLNGASNKNDVKELLILNYEHDAEIQKRLCIPRLDGVLTEPQLPQ